MTPAIALATAAAPRPTDATNLHGHDTGREALTLGAISTLLACEQKFRWAHEERLAPEAEPSALAMGAAFAAAVAGADVDAGARRVLAGGGRVDDERRIDAVVVREAARAYLARHAGDDELVRGLDLRVRLRNPATGAYSRTFDLAVRLDAVTPDLTEVVQDRLVGQIRRADLARTLRLDRRAGLESYALWRAYGVVPRLTRCRLTLKPAIRQTKLESFDDYLARIGEEYATRPDHYLVEQPTRRTLADFLRLEQELWRWAEQVRSARADGLYPRNVARCQDFGGCAFLPLCSRERGARRRYRRRPVDPGAPADGRHVVVLEDAQALAAGALQLRWRAIGERGVAWTALVDGDEARAALTALGVDPGADLAGRRAALARSRGAYFDVSVATTGGRRATTVEGPANGVVATADDDGLAEAA